MTILLAIQEAADLLSLPRPSTAVGNSDTTVMKLLAVAHQAGDDIARRGDWSKLIKQGTITTGVIPADFQRLATGAAVQMTAPSQKMLRGPLSTEQLRSLPLFGTTSVLAYGVQGGTIVFSRALVPGEVIQCDYVSKNWLINGGASRRRALLDADTMAFSYELLTKGIMWRWRQSIGLNVEQEKADFSNDLEFELRQDRGVTT